VTFHELEDAQMIRSRRIW